MCSISTISDSDDGVVQSSSATLGDHTRLVSSEPVVLSFNGDGDWVSVDGGSEEASMGWDLSQTDNLDKWALDVWRTSTGVGVTAIVWVLFHLGNALLAGSEPNEGWVHETSLATIAA